MKEMIKKYRGSLICSVLVMLIGVLVGFTSTQSMWVNVFFVVTDCALVAITFYDNRNRQQSRKIIGMTMWIIPIITLLYNGIARLVNMGADMENLFMAVIYYGTGLLFMVIGNYLPKVKQGAKGRKIVVGNAEKKLFSAFFEHYYNVKESSASTHICSYSSALRLKPEGVSNAADAMAAIEKFVFEEEMVTLPQLVEILKNNWEGNQVLQMKMINEGAKFGNGQKEAGNLACEMVNYFVERVEAYNSRYGDLIFSPCIATFSWIVNIGKRIGASADGRMSKDPIAANMSPVLSRDVSGPMAALNSYLKLSTDSLE